jgi:hypothetical protein
MESVSGNHPCQLGRTKQYQYPVQVAPGGPLITPLDRSLLRGLAVIPNARVAQRDDLLSATAQARGGCEDLPHCARGETWWVITAHATEVIRDNGLVAAGLPPLSESQIKNQGSPCTFLQLRATLTDNTKSQGERIFEALLPENFREVTPGAPPLGGFPVAQANTIADVLLEVSAAPITWSTGISQSKGVLQNTMSFLTDGTPNPFHIPIPRGARKATVYQVGAPAIPLAWTTQLGSVIATIGDVMPLVSNIAFEVPGNACFLSGTPILGQATQFMVVWELVS